MLHVSRFSYVSFTIVVIRWRVFQEAQEVFRFHAYVSDLLL